MNTTTMVLLSLLSILTTAIIDALPDSMYAETLNQRHISHMHIAENK